jgi:hypothetical protein
MFPGRKSCTGSDTKSIFNPSFTISRINGSFDTKGQFAAKNFRRPPTGIDDASSKEEQDEYL